MVEVIDLGSKFDQVTEHWFPHVLGEVNDCFVKVAKLKGEFPWHSHEKEDELFFVVQGELTIRLRDKDIELSPGQMAIIPAGTEHQPVCENEVCVMLFEPKSTTNTGGLPSSELTRTELPKI